MMFPTWIVSARILDKINLPGPQMGYNLVLILWWHWKLSMGWVLPILSILFMTILQCLSLYLPNIGQMSSSQCLLLVSTQIGSLQDDMSSTWPFRSVGVSLLLQSNCCWPLLLFPSTFPNILDFKESDYNASFGEFISVYRTSA